MPAITGSPPSRGRQSWIGQPGRIPVEDDQIGPPGNPAALKISGFTFARNAVKLQYPIVESIRSILPIVDEFIVAVGAGEDDTAGLIRSIGSPKLRIIDSQWNP